MRPAVEEARLGVELFGLFHIPEDEDIFPRHKTILKDHNGIIFIKAAGQR